jgi:hypothetical protein
MRRRAIEITATRGTKLILHIRSGQAYVDWRMGFVSRKKTNRNECGMGERICRIYGLIVWIGKAFFTAKGAKIAKGERNIKEGKAR